MGREVAAKSALMCCSHKFSVNDLVIIMAYAHMSPEEALTFKPKVIFPDSDTNKMLT